MAKLGQVSVVAPDAERSAVGHAITTLTPLRVKEVALEDGLLGFAVNGTPADSVKLAVGALLKQRPDLVVSGINLGPNTATNVIYSGTVSAATEARILGVPSIAISIGAYKDPLWATAAGFAIQVAEQVLARGLPPKVLLNVNVPNLPAAEVKGVKVTRQGDSAYEERFDIRADPRALLLGGGNLPDERRRGGHRRARPRPRLGQRHPGLLRPDRLRTAGRDRAVVRLARMSATA